MKLAFWKRGYDEDVLATPRDTHARRRTWGRVLLIVLALLLALRVIWGFLAARDVREAAAAVQAKGEPLTLADIPSPAPGPDDAWPLYEDLLGRAQADGVGVAGPLSRKQRGEALSNEEAQALRADQAVDALWTRWWADPPAQAEALEQLQQHARQHAALLDALREATRRPTVAWPVRDDPLDPIAATTAPLHRLAQLTLARGYAAFAAGDDAAAIEDLATVVRLANHLSQFPSLEGRSLEAVLIHAAALQLQEMLPGLALPEPATGGLRDALAGGTTPQRLRESIVFDRAQRHSIYDALVRGRLAMDGTAAGGWGTRVKHWILRPFMDASEAYNLQVLGELVGLADRPYHEVADALSRHVAAAEHDLEGSAGLTHRWGAVNVLHVAAAMRATAASLAQRRMATIALAAREYQLAHGQLPAALNALAPEPPASLPEDPMTGRALGYLPGTGAPRLYSPGLDRANNGGTYDLVDDPYGLQGHDLVFFLGGIPADARPPAPTTATAPATVSATAAP